MVLRRLMDRRFSSRVDAVNGFSFPAGALHAFRSRFPEAGPEDVRRVEAATRQWLRVLARAARAELGMPSVAVDVLWRETARHTGEYGALCAAAFGSSRRGTEGVAGVDGSAPALLRTLRLARLDGRHGPAELPALFRVDGETRLPDGRRYLADCGGRGSCFEAAGLVCLQHLAGPGRRLEPRGLRGHRISGRQYRHHGDVLPDDIGFGGII
jgi:hypothetical protein